MIDAGSTGSRVLGFSFHRSIIDNSLQLDEELWKQVKPGLSFYHEQPENCSHGMLNRLFKEEKDLERYILFVNNYLPGYNFFLYFIHLYRTN